MCGVPVERADDYLHRLIALGHRVAVCEQIEDPAEARKRGAKSVVRRDVVRLVTPGTLTEDTLLDARRNNYLLAIARARASSSDGDAASRSPGSTSRPASSASTECDRAALARRDRAARAGRDHRVRRALCRSGARAVPARRCRRSRRCRATCSTARPPSGGSRLISRSRPPRPSARSRGSSSTAAAACVTYVERTQLGKRPPLSPPAREARRRDAGDRRGDARQSRTDAHARRASGAARCSPRSTAP